MYIQLWIRTEPKMVSGLVSDSDSDFKTRKGFQMAKNRNRRNAAVAVPKEIEELTGDSEVEIIDRATLDKPAVRVDVVVSAEPPGGGTDVGKMVGDVNPIVTAGYSVHQLFERHKSKSGVIRALAEAGFQTKHISKFLNIRYQHVRNVLMNPLKKEGATATAMAPTPKPAPGEGGDEDGGDEEE